MRLLFLERDIDKALRRMALEEKNLIMKSSLIEYKGMLDTIVTKLVVDYDVRFREKIAMKTVWL
mgnify:CR=1 FL=1